MKKEEIISLLEKLQNLSCFKFYLINKDKECILNGDTFDIYYDNLELYDGKNRTKYFLIIDYYFNILEIYWMEKRVIGGLTHFYKATLDEILENVSESVKQDLIFNLDILRVKRFK